MNGIMKAQNSPSVDIKPTNQNQQSISNIVSNSIVEKGIAISQRNNLNEANTIGSKTAMRTNATVYNNVKEMRTDRHHRHHHSRHHKHHKKNTNQQGHAVNKHHQI